MFESIISVEIDRYPHIYTGRKAIDSIIFVLRKSFSNTFSFGILGLLFILQYIGYDNEILLKIGAAYFLLLISAFIVEELLVIKFGTIKPIKRESWENVMFAISYYSFLLLGILFFTIIFEYLPIEWFSYKIDLINDKVILSEKLIYLSGFLFVTAFLPFLVIGLMLVLETFNLLGLFIKNVIFPYLLMVGLGLLIVLIVLLYLSAAVNIILSLLPIYLLILIGIVTGIVWISKK